MLKERTNFEALAPVSQLYLDGSQPYIEKANQGDLTYHINDSSDSLVSPVVESRKVPKWRIVAAVGSATIAGLVAGHESADPLKAEETAQTPEVSVAVTDTEDAIMNIQMVEPEAPKPKPKPKNPWKLAIHKPSHGPLSRKRQRELNSITMPMYRKMIKIGNDCEGRRGKWRKDNGAYGGGLNITDANWRSRQYGGKDFAPKAEKATPAEQMVVMMRIQASFGWGVPNWCPLAQYGPWKPQYKVFKYRR